MCPTVGRRHPHSRRGRRLTTLEGACAPLTPASCEARQHTISAAASVLPSCCPGAEAHRQQTHPLLADNWDPADHTGSPGHCCCSQCLCYKQHKQCSSLHCCVLKNHGPACCASRSSVFCEQGTSSENCPHTLPCALQQLLGHVRTNSVCYASGCSCGERPGKAAGGS